MENGDYRDMSDCKFEEQTGEMPAFKGAFGEMFKMIPMSEAIAGAKYVSWSEIERELSSDELGKSIAELRTDYLHVEAARAAVDRIAAGKSSLEAECSRLGYSHEQVREQVEAERGAAERLGLSVPKANRPDEHWWIRTDEGMPLEPACIAFEGDAPARVQLLGDDSWGGAPVEDFQWTHTDEDGVTTVNTRLELVERILPPGRVAEVAEAIEDVLCSPGEDLKNEAARDALRVLRGEPEGA